MNFTDSMRSMYVPYRHEGEAFGEHWTAPALYRHGEDVGCALYIKNPLDGDGQSVEVYCNAMPARFYRLKVLPGVNSVNKEQNGYEITTGSGQAELVAKLAEAISQGMIGFAPNGLGKQP